jgi:hypothetical protein
VARPLDESLIAAYRATEYRVCANPPFVLRIGERCPALVELLARSGTTGGAFLTAWNPYSEPAPFAVNRNRQDKLVQIVEARGWRHLPGEGRGRDPDWPPEPSILAIGPDREEARALARDFRQHAIVWVAAGEPAELDIL